MLEKRNLELTYDRDGETAVQQMVTDSYHVGFIDENLQNVENQEQV